jgi:hypothetical protein
MQYLARSAAVRAVANVASLLSTVAKGARATAMPRQNVVNTHEKARKTVPSMSAAGKRLRNLVTSLCSLTIKIDSQWGFCGTTDGFCGDGCQPNSKGGGCGDAPYVNVIPTPCLSEISVADSISTPAARVVVVQTLMF